jgi:hypothetical protein
MEDRATRALAWVVVSLWPRSWRQHLRACIFLTGMLTGAIAASLVTAVMLLT